MLDVSSFNGSDSLLNVSGRLQRTAAEAELHLQQLWLWHFSSAMKARARTSCTLAIMVATSQVSAGSGPFYNSSFFCSCEAMGHIPSLSHCAAQWLCFLEALLCLSSDADD